jgi:two-component system alkaline phosphatase synthesis response regulator PhoP
MEIQEYKILLVDDEPDIIEFLGYNLKKEGFKIYTASNGKQAIETAKQINPHLILLDVMMPEMDGIETCEKIREIPTLNRTLIAFLTARGEDYSQIAGFEAGGDDYITKPVKPRVLVSRINALLKRINSGIESLPESSPKRIEKGDLIIDKEKYVIIKNN